MQTLPLVSPERQWEIAGSEALDEVLKQKNVMRLI